MNVIPNSLRAMLPHAAGLALALSLHAEPAMPETPADVQAPPADAVKTATGLAYGENPGGGRPGGMLVFDIELLQIVK